MLESLRLNGGLLPIHTQMYTIDSELLSINSSSRSASKLDRGIYVYIMYKSNLKIGMYNLDGPRTNARYVIPISVERQSGALVATTYVGLIHIQYRIQSY